MNHYLSDKNASLIENFCIKDPWDAEIKKRDFGDGIWIDEPDYAEFSYKGVRCMVERNHSGAFCGYIFVNSGHPWYGKRCDEIKVEVHGGFTWSEYIEKENTYKIGFDCAHLEDIIPRASKEVTAFLFLQAKKLGMTVTYKDLDYVVGECIRLAEASIVEARTIEIDQKKPRA